jgi:hypothetical protein
MIGSLTAIALFLPLKLRCFCDLIHNQQNRIAGIVKGNVLRVIKFLSKFKEDVMTNALIDKGIILPSGQIRKDILVSDWKYRPQFAVGQRKRVLLTRVNGKFKCSSV